VHAVAPINASELTYVLSRIVWNYWNRGAGRFREISDIRAALASTLEEFNRRIAAPYEDAAIARNGDL
jgi:hypothetical protein